MSFHVIPLFFYFSTFSLRLTVTSRVKRDHTWVVGSGPTFQDHAARFFFVKAMEYLTFHINETKLFSDSSLFCCSDGTDEDGFGPIRQTICLRQRTPDPSLLPFNSRSNCEQVRNFTQIRWKKRGLIKTSKLQISCLSLWLKEKIRKH